MNKAIYVLLTVVGILMSLSYIINAETKELSSALIMGGYLGVLSLVLHYRFDEDVWLHFGYKAYYAIAGVLIAASCIYQSLGTGSYQEISAFSMGAYMILLSVILFLKGTDWVNHVLYYILKKVT